MVGCCEFFAAVDGRDRCFDVPLLGLTVCTQSLARYQVVSNARIQVVGGSSRANKAVQCVACL